MLGIIALVVDLGNARQQRRVAQASADAAALAGGEAIESGHGPRHGNDPVVDGRHADQELRQGQRQHRADARGSGAPTPTSWRTAPTPRTATAASRRPPSSYPAPSSSSVGNNINYLRVRLPSSTVKSYFAKAIGNGDLTVGASSTAKVVFTVAASQTTTLAAGGPCALCILSPTGLTLDGQNGDVTITDGNVIVNSTSGTAASLNPNGHVKITTVGGSIGGPGSCAPGELQQLLGRGLLAGVVAAGRGDRPARQRAPVRQRLAGHHQLLPDDEPDRRLERQHAAARHLQRDQELAHAEPRASTCSPATSP